MGGTTCLYLYQNTFFQIIYILLFVSLSCNYVRWWMDLGRLGGDGGLPRTLLAQMILGLGFILFCMTWVGLWHYELGKGSFRGLVVFLILYAPALCCMVWALESFLLPET